MPAPAPALTPRQQRFVEEYLVDLCATQAAIRAGYSARTANRAGTRLLSNAVIQAAIQAARQAQQRRTQITADRVLDEYALVAFSDLGELLDFTGDAPRLRPCREIPERARRALASVKVRRYTEGGGEDAREVEVAEFRLWDKLNALEKLARRLGLVPNRQEITGPDGGPIPLAVQVVEEIVDAPAPGPGPAAPGAGPVPPE